MFQRGKRRIQKLKLPPSGLSKSESNSRLHSPHSELMDKEERQKMNKSPGLNESIETEEDISISEGPMFQRTPSVNEKIYEFAEKVHSNLKPSSHLNKSPLQKSKSRKNFENKEEKIEEKQIEESEDDNDDDDDEDDSGEEDSDTGENNDEEVIMDRLERLKALLLQSTEYDIGAETEMEITTSANTILDSLFVKRPNDPRRYISLENLRKPDLHQIHSELRRVRFFSFSFLIYLYFFYKFFFYFFF